MILQMPLWGMLVSSTYGIVALTFERFLAVVYPIWHKTKFNRRKVRLPDERYEKTRLRNDMLRVEWDVNPLTGTLKQQSNRP